MIEASAEGVIDPVHVGLGADGGEARDRRIVQSARHDAGEMFERRFDVQATPCRLIQRRTRTPMLAIFSV